MCTAVLIGWDPAIPPSPHLGTYTRALLVSQDRWHLFVTTWTPLCHALWYPVLKPVYRSLARDQSYRLSYFFWQKLVFYPSYRTSFISSLIEPPQWCGRDQREAKVKMTGPDLIKRKPLLLCSCPFHGITFRGAFGSSDAVRHVTGNDQDYLRKIPRVVVQKSALL